MILLSVSGTCSLKNRLHFAILLLASTSYFESLIGLLLTITDFLKFLMGASVVLYIICSLCIRYMWFVLHRAERLKWLLVVSSSPMVDGGPNEDISRQAYRSWHAKRVGIQWTSIIRRSNH